MHELPYQSPGDRPGLEEAHLKIYLVGLFDNTIPGLQILFVFYKKLLEVIFGVLFLEPAESRPRLQLTIASIGSNIPFAPRTSARANEVTAVTNNIEEIAAVSAEVIGTTVPFTTLVLILLVFEISVQIEQVRVLRLKFDTGHEASIEIRHF